MEKKLIHYSGLLLSIASVGMLISIFIRNFGKVNFSIYTFHDYLLLLALALLGVVTYIILAFSWYIQLNGKYADFRFLDSCRIIGLSQIGKYLPGNIGQFVGRFYLSSKYIKKEDVAYTMIIENIIVVILALGLGMFYTTYLNIFALVHKGKVFYFLIIASVLFLLFLISLKFTRKKLDILKLSISNIIGVTFILSVLYLTGGTSIYVIISFFTNYDISLMQCVAGFAISFLIGFIIPGAPGGIGVREYAFVLLFTPFMGEFLSLQTIVLFRIVSISSDFLTFVCAKLLQNKYNITG